MIPRYWSKYLFFQIFLRFPLIYSTSHFWFYLWMINRWFWLSYNLLIVLTKVIDILFWWWLIGAIKLQCKFILRVFIIYKVFPQILLQIRQYFDGLCLGFDSTEHIFLNGFLILFHLALFDIVKFLIDYQLVFDLSN